MFYDILILLILLICLLVGVARGAIKTLVSIVISIVSYFLSAFLGNALANWIYTAFILPSITNSVTQAVNNVDLSSISNPVDSVLNSLPGYVKAALSISGSDFSNAIANAKTMSSDAIVSAIDSSARGAIVSFIAFFTILLMFFIISTVLRLTIGKMIVRSIRTSALRTVDRFFGAVLGILKAFVIVSFLAFLWHLILPSLTDIPQFLDEASVNSSLIFSWFYNGNIFTSLVNGVLGV